jgi:hypothetical protein
MRNFISCIFILIVIIIASFIYGCGGTVVEDENAEVSEVSKATGVNDKRKEECGSLFSGIGNANYKDLMNNAQRYTRLRCKDFYSVQKITERAEQLINEIDVIMRNEVEKLSIPISSVNFSDIQRICQINEVKRAKIQSLRKLGAGGDISIETAKRLCSKIRDFVHYNLNLRNNNPERILAVIRESERVMKGCETCTEEFAEIQKWSSFYTRCIKEKNCEKGASIVVEAVSNINKRGFLGRFLGKSDIGEISVRIELSNSDVGVIDLNERGRKINGYNNISVRHGEVLKVYIIRKTRSSVEHLNFMSIDILPDFCGAGNPEGKVFPLKHRINEKEWVEVRIKTVKIGGERCPWRV